MSLDSIVDYETETEKAHKSSLNSDETETLSESIEGSNLLGNLMGGSGVRSGFLSDIYNEELKTPHQEMRRIREMIMTNAFVQTALGTVADLLLGKYQKPVSEDEATQEYFQEKFVPNTNIKRTMKVTAEDFIGYGNYYFEKRRGKKTGIPKKFSAIAHPERMWRDIQSGNTQRYILEIPSQLANKDDLKKYQVGYGRYKRRGIYGIEYDKDKIGDGRMGQGDYKHYGRSPLASALSDHKILKEIERSMAVFSRFKSVPKKIMSLKGNDGQPLSSAEFNQTLQDWNQLSDFDNFVTNGKQFDIEDMDYAGNQVNFENMINYLKRKITSVLGPEFYFHGENTTHAVSNSQQTTFYLRIQSWRDQYLEAWDECLKEVARKEGLSDDIHWELGPFDFETDKEKREKAIKAWEAGAITNNEARELLGLDPAEDEEVGRAYKWDVQDQQPMQPVQQKLEDLLEEQEEG